MINVDTYIFMVGAGGYCDSAADLCLILYSWRCLVLLSKDFLVKYVCQNAQSN